MISEKYNGYSITASPFQMKSGKWAVAAIIEKKTGNDLKSKNFFADDSIHYILEIEAAKEGINLGKNLINRNLVGF
ncbi:MAG: hypothetical protein JW874_14040 [Spirochaetales bacterium]|nr:hypothetical protein [Spirochaetales bacterium]